MLLDPSRRVDAVLFDLDGVLVDSLPCWNETRVAFAAARGLTWGDADEQACMGGNSLEWAAVMQQRLGLAGVPVEQIAADIVAGVVGGFRRGGVEVVEGAPEAVRRIAARRPVALASSAHPEVIAAAIELLGLPGVFAAVTSSDEVARGKPDPEVYLLAARRLGVTPERCIVVEDSTAGVLAGKAAGAQVVLVPNAAALPDAQGYAAADAVVGRLADLDPDALRD